MSAPGMWFGDDKQAKRLCRHCNDHAATIRKAHPERLGMFANLALPDSFLNYAAPAIDGAKARPDGTAPVINLL